MKALTPELEAILKSKFQAAADGFRGRIEIDTGDAAVFLQYTDTWSILQGARNHSPGFEAIDFDDSSWARAPGPFGSAGACGYGISTAWSVNTDLCLRTTVQVPAGLASMSFEFGIDNDCYIYWDGVQTNVTGHEGCVGPADFTMVIPSPSAGPHRLAVRAIDRGDQSYFGIRAIPTDMSETLTFLPDAHQHRQVPPHDGRPGHDRAAQRGRLLRVWLDIPLPQGLSHPHRTSGTGMRHENAHSGPRGDPQVEVPSRS